MRRLFKISKKQLADNTATERIANRIVVQVLKLQEKWAALMMRQTERLSLQSKKAVLILFCLLTTGLSVLIIIHSISSTAHKSLSIIKIKVPGQLTKNGEENTYPSTLITDTEYKKLTIFKAYIDSLNKSVSGQKIAQDILMNRPALMDSIIQFEKLYRIQQSQKK